MRDITTSTAGREGGGDGLASRRPEQGPLQAALAVPRHASAGKPLPRLCMQEPCTQLLLPPHACLRTARLPRAPTCKRHDRQRHTAQPGPAGRPRRRHPRQRQPPRGPQLGGGRQVGGKEGGGKAQQHGVDSQGGAAGAQQAQAGDEALAQERSQEATGWGGGGGGGECWRAARGAYRGRSGSAAGCCGCCQHLLAQPPRNTAMAFPSKPHRVRKAVMRPPGGVGRVGGWAGMEGGRVGRYGGWAGGQVWRVGGWAGMEGGRVGRYGGWAGGQVWRVGGWAGMEGGRVGRYGGWPDGVCVWWWWWLCVCVVGGVGGGGGGAGVVGGVCGGWGWRRRRLSGARPTASNSQTSLPCFPPHGKPPPAPGLSTTLKKSSTKVREEGRMERRK